MTQAAVLAQMGNTNQTFRNRIINGAMMIDQRNAGASQTITSASNYFGVDRFRIGISATNAFSLSVQQVSDVPSGSGFLYSQKYTVNTGTTLAAGDTFQTGQRIEYGNVFDFGWFDSTARYYVTTYTVNSANTWEQKTITVASPIAGGVTTTLSFWVKSSLTGAFSFCYVASASPSINGTGLYALFDLGQGSTYQTSSLNTWTTSVVLSSSTANRLVTTTGATLQITGVQLEAGTTATPFEFRSYGAELALCQRYFEMTYDLGTVPGASTDIGSFYLISPGNINRVFGQVIFKVNKRASPTVTLYSTTGASGKVRDISSLTDVAAGLITTAGTTGVGVIVSAGISAVTDSVIGQWTASAEL